MGEELFEQEKNSLFLFQIKIWMIYQNRTVTRKIRSINWWYYWNSKTWNKKTGRWISWWYNGTYGCFNDSTYAIFINKVCSFYIDKYYYGKGVMRAGKGQEGGILPILALPFNAFIVLGKELQGLEKDIIIWIMWVTFFSSTPHPLMTQSTFSCLVLSF